MKRRGWLKDESYGRDDARTREMLREDVSPVGDVDGGDNEGRGPVATSSCGWLMLG